MGSTEPNIINCYTNPQPILSSVEVEIMTPDMVGPFPEALPRKINRGRQDQNIDNYPSEGICQQWMSPKMYNKNFIPNNDRFDEP